MHVWHVDIIKQENQNSACAALLAMLARVVSHGCAPAACVWTKKRNARADVLIQQTLGPGVGDGAMGRSSAPLSQ
jgi:hypothetical protein